MKSLDDFDFLVIGLFRAPLENVRSAVVGIITEHFPVNRFDMSSAPLDIGQIYKRKPPRGGRHGKRAVFFEPSNARGTTVFIANIEDGWYTLCNVLASKVPGEHIHARSCLDRNYPVTNFEVWLEGVSVRVVSALREERKWEFFERGEQRSFEEPANYKKRRIADRLNRGILVKYLAKVGWDLASSEFWTSQIPAYYLIENRNDVSND